MDWNSVLQSLITLIKTSRKCLGNTKTRISTFKNCFYYCSNPHWILHTVFENYSKCRIWIFQFFLSDLNWPVWYTDRKLKIDLFWHFFQNVNVARFARNVEWDFFCDFQSWIRIWKVTMMLQLSFFFTRSWYVWGPEFYNCNEWDKNNITCSMFCIVLQKAAQDNAFACWNEILLRHDCRAKS